MVVISQEIPAGKWMRSAGLKNTARLMVDERAVNFKSGVKISNQATVKVSKRRESDAMSSPEKLERMWNRGENKSAG